VTLQRAAQRVLGLTSLSAKLTTIQKHADTGRRRGWTVETVAQVKMKLAD
jgi:hypothetical protein